MKVIDLNNSEISDESSNGGYNENKKDDGKINKKGKEKEIWNGKVFKKDRGDVIPSLKVKKRFEIIDKSFQGKKSSDPFPIYNNRSRNMNFSLQNHSKNSINPIQMELNHN